MRHKWGLFHRWGKWHVVTGELSSGRPVSYQERQCLVCGKKQFEGMYV